MSHPAPPADDSLPHAPQALRARAIDVLLTFVVLFVLAAEPVPHVNEPHYLSRMKHFWNPTWCAGDVFLESPDAHGMFVWSLGWITRFLSLPATAWTLRLLAWGLLAWAWQRLSWRIIPAPLAAALSAGLWITLIETTHLAGEWVIGGVEAKCFAYVFVVVALTAVIDRRWNLAWLALGVASSFHVLVGGWSTIVCGAIWLADQWRSKQLATTSIGRHTSLGQEVRRMLPGLVAGGAIGLCGLLPALALTRGKDPAVVAAANEIYVFERLPHHLAPLMLPAGQFATRLARHSLAIVALWWLARSRRQANDLASRGLIVVERYAWGAVALAAVGFIIELTLWNEPRWAAALLRYYWFRLTDVAVPLAVALQATAAVAALLHTQRRGAVACLVALLLLVVGQMAGHTVRRVINPTPPADVALRDPAAWVDVCDWIAQNTPADAVFLTPRLAATFKWRTSRPEIATRKDVPQDAESMVAWFDKLRDIYYYPLGNTLQSFNSVGELGTARAVEVARRYGARYIVSDQSHPLALRPIYPTAADPNDEYVVYELDP